MAAGAVERQSQECLAHRADHVFQLVAAHDRLHHTGELVLTDGVKGPGYEKPGRRDCPRVVRTEHVAGQLQPGKLVVRHVEVQGVAPPSRGTARRPGGTRRTRSRCSRRIERDRATIAPSGPRIGVRRGIGPPTCAIRVERVVLNERLDLLGPGGQAREVKAEPADQDPSVGLRRRRKLMRLELLEDEEVNRRSDPFPPAHGGKHRPIDRLERPPIAAGAARRRDLKWVDRVAAPACPAGDPLAQDCLLAVGQGRLGRHLTGRRPVPRASCLPASPVRSVLRSFRPRTPRRASTG